MREDREYTQINKTFSLSNNCKCNGEKEVRWIRSTAVWNCNLSRVVSLRKYLSKGLKEVRECEPLGGKAFQAREAASAEVLRKEQEKKRS